MKFRTQKRTWKGSGSQSGSWLCIAILSAATLPLFGCSKGGLSGPQGTVHGKVTYNTGPVVPGALVSFISDSGGSASAVISSDGTYRLASPQGAGVPVGKYKVIVVPPKTGPELSPDEAMEASKKSADNNGMGASVSPLPKRYQNPATTPETREVVEGDNEINIDLTDL
jgi:hypothetical protein